MTRITLAVQNKEDQQLLLSIARRLKIKVVQVEEEPVPGESGNIHKLLTGRFLLNCEKFPEIVSHSKKAITTFEKTISALPAPVLQNLVFSLTDSGSIYFRFSLLEKPDSEVHLEVFYISDGNDDVEAVLNIYVENEVITKKYGSLKGILETIRQINRSSVYS